MVKERKDEPKDDKKPKKESDLKKFLNKRSFIYLSAAVFFVVFIVVGAFFTAAFFTVFVLLLGALLSDPPQPTNKASATNVKMFLNFIFDWF